MSVDKKIEELEVNRAPMNISRETIEFIVNSVLFEDVKVLEIGTFNGYSALWFSTIASRVLGIDISGTNVEEARKNLEGTDVEIVLGNALDIVPKLEEKFNVVLIDAQKNEYGSYLEVVLDKLEDDFLIFVDNTISHGGKITSLFEVLKKHSELEWKEMGIGKGLIVIKNKSKFQ
ncbi:methyltransferase domain-containing protein [Candidatus Woesearchaeota archaeon]|mgnify:FL=1|nr:methyltransferase domain-containing protein [Candidatus Woesearchaeota archaeon]